MSQSDQGRRNTAAGHTTRLNPVTPHEECEHEGVRNFPWHALTDIPRSHAEAINRLLRLTPEIGERSGGDAIHTAVATALEKATGLTHAVEWRGLRIRRPDEIDWPVEGGHVSKLEWIDGGGVGALSVSRDPVGAWLNAMIDQREMDYRNVPAPLTPEESGVVTYVLCHARRVLVDRGAPPATLSVQPPDEELLGHAIQRGGGAVELRWFVRAGDGLGSARLVVPLAWVDSLDATFTGSRTSAGCVGSAGRVELQLPVTVGRVQLLGREIEQAGSDAVVLLEEHGFGAGVESLNQQSSKGGGRLLLNHGSYLVGTVRAPSVGRPWQFRLDSNAVHECERPTTAGDTEMNHEDQREARDGDKTGQRSGPSSERVPPTEMLERPQIEVAVRLGEVQMSVAELSDLKAGSIVELSSRPGEPVELVANGRVVAEGELVTVEGRLGVRLIRDG